MTSIYIITVRSKSAYSVFFLHILFRPGHLPRRQPAGPGEGEVAETDGDLQQDGGTVNGHPQERQEIQGRL